MEVSRREFLLLLGISGTGATLAGAGCDNVWSIPDDVYKKVAGAPRIESWKTSVCSLCSAGCGIKVRLIDGIPVRIMGNPLHPVNRGGICPMGEAGIESLFNPDRLKTPMKRVGNRGEGKWESTTWDDALNIVTTRLKSLRKRNAEHELVFWAGDDRNLLARLINTFMQAYGSPNLHYINENNCSNLVTYITQGHKQHLGYNFNDIQLVLNFGGDFLDVGPSPIRFNQIYSELRSREDGRKAKIIHIDSHLSRTAARSHAWVPVNPGTMGALALGIANVIIRDREYDAGFANSECFGFADWTDKDGSNHLGFSSFVKNEYPPEKVAEITGVQASKIVELARELGAADSALVLAGGQVSNSTNSLYTLWAIECLNALKGNFRKGGPITRTAAPPFTGFVQSPDNGHPDGWKNNPDSGKTPETFCLQVDPIESLGNMVLDKGQHQVDTLFLSNVNPIFSSINKPRLESALKEVPFIVSFDPFVDDTSTFADLILPDLSFLEKHEVHYNVPMVEYSYFGVQQPVLEPLYQSLQTGDVILQIAQRLGGSTKTSLPWTDYKEYLHYQIDNVYRTGAGTIFNERTDKAWMEYLKERGWQVLPYTSVDEFMDVLAENGGWWDPFPSEVDATVRFETPSEKYEYYSQILMHELISEMKNDASPSVDMGAVLKRRRVESHGDTAFLPHYEAPRFYEPTEQYELHLLTYQLITNTTGSGGNLPLMQELFGMLRREFWNTWIEMHPDTARKYRIEEGEIVRVVSPQGHLNVKAKLLQSIMPGLVFIPFGLGHKEYGRYASGIGSNPYEILQADYDFLSGRPSLISTKVTLEKTSGKEAT